MKEDEFREGKQAMEMELAKFRIKNLKLQQAMPAELKQRKEQYTSAALKKLTNERVAAEKHAEEALLATRGQCPGRSQRRRRGRLA